MDLTSLLSLPLRSPCDLRALTPVHSRAYCSQSQRDGGGGQVLSGEVCGGVPSRSGERQSAACEPFEPQSLPGGAAWGEPGAGPEAADCQV